MDRERICWAIDFGAAAVFAACAGWSGILAQNAGALSPGVLAIMAPMMLAYLGAFMVLRRNVAPVLPRLPAFTPVSFDQFPVALELDDELHQPDDRSRVVRLFGAEEPAVASGDRAGVDQDSADELMVAALADIRMALGQAVSIRNR